MQRPRMDCRQDEPLEMQLGEADYFTERDGDETHTFLRLFGNTLSGASVLLRVCGFLPYFYARLWPGFTPNDLRAIRSQLNDELDRAKGGRKDGGPSWNKRRVVEHVVEMHVEQKHALYGYEPDAAPHLKILLREPSQVACARKVLETGLCCTRGVPRRLETCESNVPFVLRFLVDKDLRGGGWLRVTRHFPRSSQCCTAQLQLEAHADHVQALNERHDLAPRKVLSFDLECCGSKGFPTAERDPVIQIANVLQQGDKVLDQVVFVLGSCARLPEGRVLSFDTEQELLMRWREFLLATDPDVLTGYNIVNFDLPYLLNRAKALGLLGFPFLGRLGLESTMRLSTFNSKAHGPRENHDIVIHGREQFDVLSAVRREYKLSSYTLNAVCAHFLGAQKDNVHYSDIPRLHAGSADDRARLAAYCLKDAQLPLRLIDKLLLLVNYTEMARVTGVPQSYLLTRGQQIKVLSQLLRKARQRGFVVPTRQTGKEEAEEPDDEDEDDIRVKRSKTEQKTDAGVGYQGATVLEPVLGYHTQPIATLDFASLYPSIMQAHNLCYTTWMRVACPLACTTAPSGERFVARSVRRGLLPEILDELLEARKRAKRAMAEAQDPMLKAVHNGRQLALKISANSVYGFCGAQVGQLPCLAISATVTAFGREMIERTRELVLSRFPGSEVIYGDTDSVMVKFQQQDRQSVSEAMRLGKEAADWISTQFVSPIRLEFEKVYCPYLLMAKKRYAGLYWSNPTAFDKLDTKGIETVRRDTCRLVRQVIEQCLQLLLVQRDVDAVVDYVKHTVSELLQNKLDISLLVVSKALSKATPQDYKTPQVHVELAKKLARRDPSRAPNVGDRVPYVILQSHAGAKLFSKGEDPLYALANNQPLDLRYYLEHQLQPAVTRLLQCVLPPSQLRTLFSGEHMLQRVSVTPSNAPLAKFVQRGRCCVACNASVQSTRHPCCERCQPDAPELLLQHLDRLRDLERSFCDMWSQCQRCQGSLHKDILCANFDCPIFYRRTKARHDLQRAQAVLELDWG